MAEKGTRKGDYTHLAGEFYILASLNRLHKTAFLTMGNHKAVDVLVLTKDGKRKTIDVKAINKRPVYLGKMPKELFQNKEHYYVIVYFGYTTKSYMDTNMAPRVFVVPSKMFCKLAYAHADKTKSKSLAVDTPQIGEYKDRWDLLD